jgi:SAM-dependent methyltransferase
VKQDEIFAAFEADRWFARNHVALREYDLDADGPLRMLSFYNLRPERVLEVGAANGFRLAAIAARYGAKTTAVELSREAIRDGQMRYPQVEFVRGVAHALPLQQPFDLIIINFVFHWIDRAHLLQASAEVDRLLVDGGYVIIGDFAPMNLTRVPYHHLTERAVYTYKQNYAALFLASGLYRAVGLISGDHTSKQPRTDVGEHERTSVWLLKKALKEHYHE